MWYKCTCEYFYYQVNWQIKNKTFTCFNFNYSFLADEKSIESISLPASSRAEKGTFKPKIEVLGDDDSDSDTDSEEEDSGAKDDMWAKPSSGQQKLIQDMGEPSDIEKTRKLVEEVNTTDSCIKKPTDFAKERPSGMGQVINSPASLRMAMDFSEEEKKFAAMSKEEKIQDLAENLGSSSGRKYDNLDVWSPDDDLDWIVTIRKFNKSFDHVRSDTLCGRRA